VYTVLEFCCHFRCAGLYYVFLLKSDNKHFYLVNKDFQIFIIITIRPAVYFVNARSGLKVQLNLQ